MNPSKALKILEKNNDILDGDVCYRISDSICRECVIYEYFGERYKTLCDTGTKKLANAIRTELRKKKLEKLLS